MQLFIQRVYARDCILNNNGVIHPETICAAAECPTFPLLRKWYTSIEKRSTSSSCAMMKERELNFALQSDVHSFIFKLCIMIVRT